jgi:hypothetical protein
VKRALAAVFVLGVLLSACGKESEVALPSPSQFPTAAPTAEPTPTPSSTSEATDEPTSSPDGDEETPEPTIERCRNSTDETCGKFHWDPAPKKNGAMSMKVTYTPKDPKAGDVVTFTIVAEDDGGTPERKTILYGDGDTTVNNSDCEKQEKRYGAWTPPDPDEQDNTDSVSHKYTDPGNYEMLVRYSTKRCDYYGYNPYGSDGRTSVKVDVKPDLATAAPSATR